jgi:hypothetical protein
MHFITATLLKKKTDVFKDAERLDKMNVNRVLYDYKKFNQSFKELIESYAGLFELPENDEENEPAPIAKSNFMNRYGWIFSATEIAKHEGIELQKAFELNVIHALNTLSYLKAYSYYLKEASK